MGPDKPHFNLLNHTADMGIQVFGTDAKNLFETAAKSMIQIMIQAPIAEKTDTLTLEVAAKDLSDLMVRWLGEILYLLQGEKVVVTDLEIGSLSTVHLWATLRTVPFNPNTHEILSEIKAVTYHQIEVAQKGERWEAKIFFDL